MARPPPRIPIGDKAQRMGTRMHILTSAIAELPPEERSGVLLILLASMRAQDMPRRQVLFLAVRCLLHIRGTDPHWLEHLNNTLTSIVEG